jgi:hypothetical protein
MTPNEAPITVDGIVIGRIRVSLTEDADGIATAPALDRPVTASLGEQSTAPYYGRHTHSSSAPPQFQDSAAPVKHGPTFRPHLTPRGSADPEKPGHFSTADIALATHGKAEPTFPNISRGNGGIDRSSFGPELAAHPELVEKAARMVKGEVLGNATKEARIAQLETAFNRAQMRGHSLDQALLSVSEDPRRGYYAGLNAPGGGTYGPRSNVSPQELEEFKRDILGPVLAGSNLSDTGQGPMTGNASAGVARNQIAHGTPYQNWGGQGGDVLFREGPLRDLPRLPAGTSSSGFTADGKPIGVTRLGPNDSQPTAAPVSALGPSGRLPAAQGYTPRLDSVDPRLNEILAAARNQFIARHPGYEVAATSGRRDGASNAQHASEAGAIDLQIRGPNGALPNFGADSTGLYTEVAKIARGEMLARHPGLEKHFNWGGYFGADKRPGLADPKTGAGRPDLMHYDLGGMAYPGRAGITAAYRALGVLPEVNYGKSPNETAKTADQK